MTPISSKRPSINLPLFINTLSESFSDHATSKSPNSSKSPRIFEGGVVGLGIVAAMNDTNEGFSKSEPIPIVFAKPIPNFRDPTLEKDEMEELSESYTCVISHLGNGGSVKKREYFDFGVPEDKITNFGGITKSGVFFTSSPKNTEAGTLFQNADFLSFCYLCKKKLHGLDIFMYRGEKAFCSAECRCQQMLSDERRSKRGSGALKSFGYSVSPCSSPMIFSTGVAAA